MPSVKDGGVKTETTAAFFKSYVRLSENANCQASDAKKHALKAVKERKCKSLHINLALGRGWVTKKQPIAVCY